MKSILVIHQFFIIIILLYYLKYVLTSGLTTSDCGEASISRGCIKGRPIAIAVCTSSGDTILSSNFSKFGKARSTANRYLSK